MIMDPFYPAITTVVLMYVWFETEAFVEYLTTFNLGWSLFDLREYKDEKKKVPSLDYHTYLLSKYSHSFFIKLITCPVCLICWVAPLVYYIYNKEITLPLVFQEILLAWVSFFALRTIVNKSDI